MKFGTRGFSRVADFKNRTHFQYDHYLKVYSGFFKSPLSTSPKDSRNPNLVRNFRANFWLMFSLFRPRSRFEAFELFLVHFQRDSKNHAFAFCHKFLGAYVFCGSPKSDWKLKCPHFDDGHPLFYRRTDFKNCTTVQSFGRPSGFLVPLSSSPFPFLSDFRQLIMISAFLDLKLSNFFSFQRDSVMLRILPQVPWGLCFFVSPKASPFLWHWGTPVHATTHALSPVLRKDKCLRPCSSYTIRVRGSCYMSW